jgi:rhamnulokinase
MPESRSWLAFDLGAESGRAFTGSLKSGILTIKEVHRFPNEPLACGHSLHWDVERLWREMRQVLASTDGNLEGIGVDSWGVDYALLDARGELLENPHHYRDVRNPPAMAAAHDLISREEIYAETGIQFLPFNTIYQLLAAKRQSPEILRAAKQLLMIPDLFNYWLTGKAACEYTDSTTTQLVNPHTRSWSQVLIEKLEFPSHLFGEIIEPGTILGGHPAGTPVIATVSHDTASAVASVTARENTAFLSSGTWSLLGIELDAPVLTSEALVLNFTNEGGSAGTTRLLKNVMGLWMLQGCKRSWAAVGHDYEYATLIDEAMLQPAFETLIDPDDPTFLNPADMPDAIDAYCRRTQQPNPNSPGAYARAILESLAFKYRSVIAGIEKLTGSRIQQIRVIGGGSKNRCLNQFTADATGRRVIAGPSEAAVLGNLGVQMMATGGAGSLKEMRAIVERSFPTEVYEPADHDAWRQELERFDQYCELSYA